MIDQQTINKINDATNIVDVIRDFQPLKKSGVNYLALCPFHPDKNLGSFVISPKKNMCNCFRCSKGGDAIFYLMEAQGMTYPDALRYLGQKYGIEVEGSEKFRNAPKSPRRNFAVVPDNLPLMELPFSMYERSTKNLKDDVLVKWIWQHNWDGSQRARIDDVLAVYHVGTATTLKNEQFTIFWYMDEEGKLRTGKMIRYKYNGRRMKNEGGISHSTDWVHSWLFRSDKSPQYNQEKMDWKRTYFGMHLVDKVPAATINIVESEKTAILMSIAYGSPGTQLWLACGSKNNITPDRLRPLMERKRKIVLYPDRDGVKDWQDIAQAIGYRHLSVNSEPVLSWWIPTDGDHADIADIVLRMTDSHSKWGMWENVEKLAEKFDLEEVQNS